MKKGDICEGIIKKVSFPNRGTVELPDGPVIVKNGIPGQKIRFVINKKRKNRLEGRLLEVLSPSPEEVRSPVCGNFPACGGCMYQTMSYEQQLAMKAGQVRELLDRAIADAGQTDGQGAADYVFEGISGSPREFAYRNKMEFSFGDACKGGELTLGLHKKGSTYDILTVGDCRLVHPDFNRILLCVLAYFQERGTSYYHKLSHTGYLRHLLIRRGDTTGEILVNLVTTTQEEWDTAPLVQKLLELPLEGRIVGILHILNDSLADVVQSDETKILYGQDYFYENLLGLKFKITPFSFFQTNSLGAEVLYQTARDMIGIVQNSTVFDLYSGTGTIAQLLAPVAKEVVGVEIVEEAVEAARENARLNGLDNCRFLAGDVLKVLDEIPEKPDYLILDPPREGIHPKALPKIIRYGVRRMVYISCKPTSLARDLDLLIRSGYRVERVKCVDMFPQTVHVETVVMLSHKKPDSHINVKVEFGEGEGKVPLKAISERAEAYKPKERVIYKMIKEYIEAKYGFKVHTAYIAEVKRDLGLPMYDAPNAVEELKQPRKHPTAEKVEAIKDALKHFEVYNKREENKNEIKNI